MAGETWTIMVYMAGDNNLTDECVYALTEMKKANPGNRIRVFAQFDPKDDYLPTQRFRINKAQQGVATGGGRAQKLVTSLDDDITDKFPFKDESREVKRRRELAEQNRRARGGQGEAPEEEEQRTRIQETDTGSPVPLFNFISLCLEQDRTDRYMLVLSGHAAGSESDYLLRDESPGGTLTFKELQGVFQDVQKTYKDALNKDPVIDIIGLDACLMSMAEVGYELRGLTDIMVGCESYSPAAGWPYHQILTRLDRELDENITPRDFAKAIVEEYVNFYVDYRVGGLSVDQSAMDIAQIEPLKDHISNLAGTLKKELLTQDVARKTRFKNAIVLAHWDAQSYNGELYVDLFDFCACLKQRYEESEVGEQEGGAAGAPQNDVSEHCQAVMNFIEQNFVLRTCYSGHTYQYSYGVSIYFPWADVAPFYENLDFAKASGWGEFLKTYTEITRRPSRREPEQPEDAELRTLNTTAERRLFRMVGARMVGGRMVGGRMVGGKGQENPVHSMRNPPIVDFPSRCLTNKPEIIKAEKMLLSP